MASVWLAHIDTLVSGGRGGTYEGTNVADCGDLHLAVRRHRRQQPAGRRRGPAEEDAGRGVRGGARTEGRAGRVRTLRSGAELAEAPRREPSESREVDVVAVH